MNEKKQSQQLTTVGSAHHQKRQQSLGVVSSNPNMVAAAPHHHPSHHHHHNTASSHSNGVGGGSSQNPLLKSANFMQMLSSAAGNMPIEISSHALNSTMNRGQNNSQISASQAAFVRSSYAGGSRMKKGANDSSLISKNHNNNYVNAPQFQFDAHLLAQSQLEHSQILMATHNHHHNASQLKKALHEQQQQSKKIKVMRNHGASVTQGNSNNNNGGLLPSQQAALQNQLGNFSNIAQLQIQQRLQQSSSPKSPKGGNAQSANHQQLMAAQMQAVSVAASNVASLKSARRYQLMNSQQKSNQVGASGPANNSHSVGINANQNNLSPSNQFSSVANMVAPSNQTINISQMKQSAANSQKVVNLSLERPVNLNNDLIQQSPNSSDTSSINSLDQTLRLRIGGPLPKGLLSTSQSSSSQGPPVGLSIGSSGINPNHFYQQQQQQMQQNRVDLNSSGGIGTGSMPNMNCFQNGVVCGGMQQTQYSTNNSNFNSLDYSDAAVSHRRGPFNESQTAAATNQSNAQSTAIKRNNFLAILNNASAGDEESVGSRPPEANSQPNPPTLRKITLNQRILQKNMNRVSNPNASQLQQQQLLPTTAMTDIQDSQAQAINSQGRQKKFQPIVGKVSTQQLNLNQQTSSSQPRDGSLASSNASGDQAPMINVARIQQAIQKIYNNQRKNSLHNSNQNNGSENGVANSQQQPGVNSFDLNNGGQIKRKQIKIKQAFGAGGGVQGVNQSSDQTNSEKIIHISQQTTNASSHPQNSNQTVNNLMLGNESSIDQQVPTSPMNTKNQILQGQIASSSRRKMRETQRSKINMSQHMPQGNLMQQPAPVQVDTARHSYPEQQQQELTNRSHLPQANVTSSEPLVQPNPTDPTFLASHREHNARTIVSARQGRDSNLRQQNIYPESADQAVRIEDIEFPINPQLAVKYLRQYLTSYEVQEIIDYPQIYYVGVNCQKVKGQQQAEHNCGYDDQKGNYKINMRDHIGYRYEIQQFLGKGSFGIALKCFDHKRKEFIALKVIKNKKKYYYQAGVELKILQYLKENDPDDTMNIIHMKDYVVFRKHLCISFELMSINLYDFLKLNDFEGLSLGLIRRFAIQLLYALKYLREQDIIHCDLKPENILLKDPTKSGIKIIDFGSSCFQDERVYTYIQSRFYRAPEIILGIQYTPAIDMWSFGCIMAEFCIGYPIFPGEDEMEQLAMMMEVCGIPGPHILDVSQRRQKFFSDDGTPKLVPSQRNKIRKPNTKNLEEVLESDDKSFIDFVRQCLDWDPESRLTPDAALRHAWILEGLPPKVLIHHQKLHNIPTNELPPHIREMRAQYLQKEQAAAQQQQFNYTQLSNSQGGGLNAPQSQIHQQYPQPIQQHSQQQQQQQYRSEPRKQQSSILSGQNGNNNSAMIKRVNNQQHALMLMTGSGGMGGVNCGQQVLVAQSDTHLIQQQLLQQSSLLQTQPLMLGGGNGVVQQPLSIQQQALLHQSLESTQLGGVTAANNLVSPRTKKIVLNSQEAANKNHMILKAQAKNNGSGAVGNSMENKSLENTLRNRKIILSSGLKRQHDAQQPSDQAPKQIIFANNSNFISGVGTTHITDL